MKRLILAGLVAAFTIPGCIVAVERRPTRSYRPPPPPPPSDPAPEVTVEWTQARTVIVREYYDADWDTVGCFDYYERECGIPEDDLFFLLHISRLSGRNFHEVVFTYSNNDRHLFRVVRHYNIDYWGLYIDLPVGMSCPPAYQRVYGFYWNRHRHPTIVLTNYDCHALFWLRFSTHYYGWQPRDCFARWDRCVDNRESYVRVIHRDYHVAGRGGYNWARRPIVKVMVEERPERNRRIVEERQIEVRRKVEFDVKRRSEQGHQVVRPPSREERDRRVVMQQREVQEERKREVEERKRAPQKFEEYKKDDRSDNRNEPPKRPPDRRDNDNKDDRKDDRKDDNKRDDRKDDKKEDRMDNRNEPPKRPPDRKDNDNKDDRKDDNKKDDNKKEERKEPPQAPPKRNPPPPKKEEKKEEPKKEDKKEDKKDKRNPQQPDQRQQQERRQQQRDQQRQQQERQQQQQQERQQQQQQQRDQQRQQQEQRKQQEQRQQNERKQQDMKKQEEKKQNDRKQEDKKQNERKQDDKKQERKR